MANYVQSYQATKDTWNSVLHPSRAGAKQSTERTMFWRGCRKARIRHDRSLTTRSFIYTLPCPMPNSLDRGSPFKHSADPPHDQQTDAQPWSSASRLRFISRETLC